MPSYAVIGASRGIGLEFVRQLASRPATTVFALVRNTNSPLLQSFAAEHRNVHVIEGDVVDHRSLSRAAEAVAAISEGALDVLIHGAARTGGGQLFRRGFDHYKDLDELDEDFIDAFKANTLGIVHSVSVFLPLLRRGTAKKIVIIGTAGASPKFTVFAGVPDVVAYNVTKAAGLMVAAKYAVSLKREGFTVVSIHPGVVDTSATAVEPVKVDFQAVVKKMKERGIRNAEVLTPAQSVEAQLRLIESLTPEKNGAFLSYTGEDVE
ncbi:NAD-P-binding protein [Pilatotrama ljubarskyi]|nr:NAD-P-binding protein [Pilatotrama ljubarskyi]